MKTAIFFCVLICTTGSYAQHTACSSTTIDEMLVNVIASIQFLLSMMKIEFAVEPILIENKYVEGTVEFPKIQVKGLGSFTLKDSTTLQLATEDVELRLGLDYHKLTISAEYNAALTILGAFPFNKQGSIELSLNLFDIDTKTKVAFSIIPVKLQIDSTNLKIKMPNVDIDLTVSEGDNCFNSFLGWQAADVLNAVLQNEEEAINKIINDVVWKFIKDVINPILPGDKVFNLALLTDEKWLMDTLSVYGSELLKRIAKAGGVYIP